MAPQGTTVLPAMQASGGHSHEPSAPRPALARTAHRTQRLSHGWLRGASSEGVPTRRLLLSSPPDRQQQSIAGVVCSLPSARRRAGCGGRLRICFGAVEAGVPRPIGVE